MLFYPCVALAELNPYIFFYLKKSNFKNLVYLKNTTKAAQTQIASVGSINVILFDFKKIFNALNYLTNKSEARTDYFTKYLSLKSTKCAMVDNFYWT